MGAGSGVGCSFRAEPQAGPSLQGSSAPHCLEQLGGRDVPPGWQPPAVSPSQAVSFSKGMENRAPVTCLRGAGQGPFPSHPHRTRAAGGLTGGRRGEAKSLEGPGLAQPCSASSAWGRQAVSVHGRRGPGPGRSPQWLRRHPGTSPIR